MKIRTRTEVVIIHCSDSDNPDHDSIEVIDQWHKERGFACIGYNVVVTRDGRARLGRPLKAVGAHCKGVNASSIGVCFIGKTYFTEQQMNTFARIVRVARRLRLKVGPHRFYNRTKTCPNFTSDLFDFDV